MRTESVDVAVVGGGAMGLAAAWELARRGRRPVVLERFPRGHTHGASHGATRNFNDAYAEPHYLDLLSRAREGWAALSPVDGEPLLRAHGLVTHGEHDLEGIQSALVARGTRAEIIGGAEAARRWPGMRFEDAVLFSPDAGVIRAAAALTELERRVVLAGGEVRWSTPVSALEEDPSGVTLNLHHDVVIRAETVIVTAGAWTRSLLPAAPLPRLVVTEETPAHFAPRGAEAWPSFNHYAGARFPGIVYGMPTPGEGVKVGFHRVGDEVDPDARPHRPTHQAELAEYVREWMPGLDADSAAPISCTYTSTDDGDFVLDRVGRMVIGAGFSGHGFKFVPAVGAVLADLAVDPGARAAEPFRLGISRR